MSTTLVVSDLHLGALNSRADLFFSLLDSDFDRLVLNGDTVESLNFERFRRSDWRVVDRLKEIAQDGALVLIRGNHDGRIGDNENFGSLDVLAELLGTQLHEEYELQLARGPYLVLHGDRFDRTLNLTWVGNTADWCYHRIQRVSKPTARWLKGRVKHWGGVVASVKRGTIPYARIRGYVGAITGHTHYCDDDWTDGFHYLNSGCWVETPCNFIRIEDGHARLATWGEEQVRVPARTLELTAVH